MQYPVAVCGKAQRCAHSRLHTAGSTGAWCMSRLYRRESSNVRTLSRYAHTVGGLPKARARGQGCIQSAGQGRTQHGQRVPPHSQRATQSQNWAQSDPVTESGPMFKPVSPKPTGTLCNCRLYFPNKARVGSKGNRRDSGLQAGGPTYGLLMFRFRLCLLHRD